MIKTLVRIFLLSISAITLNAQTSGKISGKIIEVPNIHEASNYIACSLKTNSELVVPIYKNEKLIGQLDIDSHSINPFNLSDKALLEKICESVADDIMP